MGALGTAHYERGLAYFEVELSGHMVPEFSPVVSGGPAVPFHGPY